MKSKKLVNRLLSVLMAVIMTIGLIPMGSITVKAEKKYTVDFSEYANRSFESQVETVGKAKTQGIMSIEASIEELYGDTKDEDWEKDEVVARL